MYIFRGVDSRLVAFDCIVVSKSLQLSKPVERLAYFRSVCQIKLPAAAHTSYLSAFMLFTSSDLSDELFYLSTFG
jgi:hypothetical protein